MAAYNPNLPPQNQMMHGNGNHLHPMSQAPVPSYDGADYSFDDVQSGSRSPAESEGGQSNFTSISQRGINPRWTGGIGDRGGGAVGGYSIPRRLPPPRDDQGVLLNSNPDFELPGAGPIGRGFGGRGVGANGGRGVGGALPRGGLIGGGPYPGT